jgi:hypothetical protein
MRFTFGATGACRAPEPFSQGRQDILNAALAAEAVPDLPPPAVGRPVRQMALLEERNVNDGGCHIVQYSSDTVLYSLVGVFGVRAMG